MRNLSNNSGFIGNRTEVDTSTLPRIGGFRRDAKIWKFRIEEWFFRAGVTSSEEQFNYIVIASEDDILRDFIEKFERVAFRIYAFRVVAFKNLI